MDLGIVVASLYLSGGLALFLLGLLVYREHPEVRVHRVAALMMLFGGLGPFLAGIGLLLGWRAPGELQPANLLSGFAYLWELFFPSLLWFALIFPQERPVVQRWPRLAWLLYAPHVFHLLLLIPLGLVGRVNWQQTVESLPGGAGLLATSLGAGLQLLGLLIDGLTRIHVRFFSLINVVYSAAAVVLLAASWRSTHSPKLRRQLSVLVTGIGSGMALYLLAVPVPNLFAAEWETRVRMVLVSAGLCLGAGAIAYAIVRQSFLDLGTVMRRAILLSVISGGLVILYFLTARPMDHILGGQIGREFPLFQALFLILVIVFFHPLLGRVEGAVDRLVAGDRAAHGQVIRRLGREMISILDLGELAERLSTTLREALAVDRVRLLLADRSGERYREMVVENRDELQLTAAHPLVSRMAGLAEPVRRRELLDDAESDETRRAIGEALDALRAELVVGVPSPEEGPGVGLLAIGSKLTGSRFNAEERTLLSILAVQLGIAVRNARLHEDAVARRVVDQELAMARSIQQAILSGRRAALAEVDVAAVSLPSRHVGGDYFDLIDIGGRRLGVAIGDVSGKGIPAALLMSMLHAGLHAQVNGAAAVGQVAARMNRILYHATTAEKFATFFFGVYDARRGKLTYTNAGHNAPLVLRADGTVTRLDRGGLLLGVLEESTYPEETVAVGADDLLILFTDGVTEAADGDQVEFGEERLLDSVRRRRAAGASEIVRGIRGDVTRFTGSEGFTDDFTLIVMRPASAS